MFTRTASPILVFGFTLALLLGSATTTAGTLAIPNAFSANTTAMAAEVNANFTAVKTAVDDNDSRLAALAATIAAVQGTVATLQTDLTTANNTISTLQAGLSAANNNISALQAQLAGLASQTDLDAETAARQAADANLQGQVDALDATALAGRVSDLESNPVLALAPFVSLNTNVLNQVSGPHVIFEGVNVHIRSGADTTNEDGTLTGLGNLIIGYNEVPPGFGGERAGSHNLVVGPDHRYSSFGGLVAGHRNTISDPYPSVGGGFPQHRRRLVRQRQRRQQQHRQRQCCQHRQWSRG